MPFTAPGTLTDQQALDVAAYITSRARPDFPDKQYDWPNGGAPPDVAYQVVGRLALLGWFRERRCVLVDVGDEMARLIHLDDPTRTVGGN